MNVTADEYENRRGGFTLVELLVVMTIVALLIALLLPVVKKARGSLWKTRCAVNLRDVALANELYGQDYMGFFAPGTYTGGGWVFPGKANWGPYLTASVRHVFTCPGDATRPAEDDISYMINERTFQGNWDPRRSLSYSDNFWLRLEDIIDPGRTVYVGDWWSVNDESPWTGARLPWSSDCWPHYQGMYADFMDVHIGGFNMMLADGHVEFLEPPRDVQDLDDGVWDEHGIKTSPI